MNKVKFHKIFWSLLCVEFTRQHGMAAKENDKDNSDQYENLAQMCAINSKLAESNPAELEFLETSYKFMAAFIPSFGLPEATAAFVGVVEQAEKLARTEKRHDADLKGGTIMRVIAKHPHDSDQMRYYSNSEKDQKDMLESLRLHKSVGFDVTLKHILFFEV